ncbi:alpha/beta hydrolase [Nonomuraea sp. NPDC005650]
MSRQTRLTPEASRTRRREAREVVLVPDSGHNLPEEQPELVVEHLTRFFA